MHKTNNHAAQQWKWLHAQVPYNAGSHSFSAKSIATVCHCMYRQTWLRSGKPSRQGWQKKKKSTLIALLVKGSRKGSKCRKAKGVKIFFSAQSHNTDAGLWASVHRCQVRDVGHCLGMIGGGKCCLSETYAGKLSLGGWSLKICTFCFSCLEKFGNYTQAHTYIQAREQNTKQKR